MTESDHTSDERRRIDRRKMLAGLGATAGVAWTAPVIIDSVVTAAAAVSGACPAGTTLKRVQITFDNTTSSGSSSCSATVTSSPSCAPTNWSNGGTGSCTEITKSTSKSGSNVALTVGAATGTTLIAGEEADVLGTCHNPTSSSTSSIVFPSVDADSSVGHGTAYILYCHS